MSGNPLFSNRDQNLHFQAARDWLNRAESQVSDGQHVMASATLMLASAELKLMIEGLSARVATLAAQPSKSIFTLLKLNPGIVGAIAMAGCLLFGIWVGQMIPSNPSVVPEQASGVSLASDTEKPVDRALMAKLPKVAENPAENTIIEETPADAVEAAETEAAESQPTAPRRTSTRPRARANPIIEEPVAEAASSEPVTVSEPEPVNVSEPADNQPVKLNAAELSLRTIRALTERMLDGMSE